ncbi:hypothetical protein [Pseudomonas mohnii]
MTQIKARFRSGFFTLPLALVARDAKVANPQPSEVVMKKRKLLSVVLSVAASFFFLATLIVTVWDARRFYSYLDNPGCCAAVATTWVANPWTYMMVDEWTTPTWQNLPGESTEALLSYGKVNGTPKFMKFLGERPINK